jgi:hypothetical protein
LVQNFFACGAQDIISTQCFIWEVLGIAAASMEARVMRVLPSNAFASPAGNILLGISAASSSFGSSMWRGEKAAFSAFRHRRSRVAICAVPLGCPRPAAAIGPSTVRCLCCAALCAWSVPGTFAALWILLASMLDAGAVCVCVRVELLIHDA